MKRLIRRQKHFYFLVLTQPESARLPHVCTPDIKRFYFYITALLLCCREQKKTGLSGLFIEGAADLRSRRCKCAPGVTCNKGPVVVNVALSVAERRVVTVHLLYLLSQGWAVSTRGGMLPNGPVCVATTFSPAARLLALSCAAVSFALGQRGEKSSLTLEVVVLLKIKVSGISKMTIEGSHDHLSTSSGLRASTKTEMYTFKNSLVGDNQTWVCWVMGLTTKASLY